MSHHPASTITSVTFAYPDVDGATRARLATRITEVGAEATAFLLSTCLRTEVAVAGDLVDLRRSVTEIFGDDVTDLGKTREGGDAVEHLYRVAAGLESPISGEREIHTQYRQALQRSPRPTGLFAKLLEQGVAVGRAAREVIPGTPHDSMAAVAAQVVGQHARVAVLGSGTMATALVMALRGLPAPPDITVVARNPAQVSIRDVPVADLDSVEDVLATWPAVISATSARHTLVDSSVVRRAVEGRRSRLTVVDMAMPPDFDLDPALPIDHYDIDDLARMADRRRRTADADELVRAAAVDAHRAFADHDRVGPVIGGLIRYADHIVDEAVERFRGRMRHPEDIDVVRQTAHTVARTLMAQPIAHLRADDRSDDAVEVIADAYGLDA